MSKLAKTLTLCAASFLALCSVVDLASATPRATERQHPERFVRIAGFDWFKAVPEDLMQANLTIESALPFALKAVEVGCAQFARSGVEIESSRRTIAEVVPAHGRLQVAALDLGPIHPQAGSSGCWIVSVTPA